MQVFAGFTEHLQHRFEALDLALRTIELQPRCHAGIGRKTKTVRRAVFYLLLHGLSEQPLELAAIIAKERLAKLREVSFHFLQKPLDLVEHVLELLRGEPEFFHDAAVEGV